MTNDGRVQPVSNQRDSDTTPVAKGGFDGILVTFGEGTDDDTLNTTFPYESIRLTLGDGQSTEVENRHFGWHDGLLVFRYRLWDDEDGGGTGEVLTVPAADVIGIHVN